MLLQNYLDIVKSTDHLSDHDIDKRKQIVLYGLMGEIGSLTSAVKKAMLARYGDASNDEVIEELGDVFWYLFNFSNILEHDETRDILKDDINHVWEEVTDPSDRGRRIRGALEILDGTRLQIFQQTAREFLSTEATNFDQYQKTAYLTARTEGSVLVDVCLAVLWQLGAELLREFSMPSMEQEINKNIVSRDPRTVIGEIAWHLAAIASVQKISLTEVIRNNIKKAKFRSHGENCHPHYDDSFPEEERFPRKIEVAFISTSSKRARMYYGGRPLGNDLTDNAYEEDGYRFHDVMHLANAACLGWSPVLRGLLRRKRKSCPATDEVEDGARASIVEELVIKAVHAEGKKLQPRDLKGDMPLFPEMGHITFGLVKTIFEYVKGLEVENSQEWQWRQAIFQGHKVYHQLRQEGQGTVTVNLDDRSLSFDPSVNVGLTGVVRKLGTSALKIDDIDTHAGWVTTDEIQDNASTSIRAEIVATKQAILDALEFSNDEISGLQREVVLTHMKMGKFSVKAKGKVQQRIWELGIIEFKSSVNHVDRVLFCTVLGLADPNDVRS